MAAESKTSLKVGGNHKGRAILPTPFPMRGTPRLHHSLRKAGPSQVFISALKTVFFLQFFSQPRKPQDAFTQNRAQASLSKPKACHPPSRISESPLASPSLSCAVPAHLSPLLPISRRLLPNTNFDPTNFGTTVTTARPPFSGQRVPSEGTLLSVSALGLPSGKNTIN